MVHDPKRCGQNPQTIIVTGASSGIGRALALQLAKGGSPIIAIGRDAQRLAALKGEAPHIETIAFDLACVDRIDALAADLVARHAAIDGLINNAAIQNDLRIDDAEYSTAQITKEIATNLAAPIALARCLLPRLMRQPRAVIVNISSGLGFVPKRTSAVYSATKAGLHLFSEALRVHLTGSQVRVVEAVMPMVDTPMTAGRGRGKISADAAAAAIIAGLWEGPQRLFVGRARLLPPLVRFAPSLAARIVQRT